MNVNVLDPLLHALIALGLLATYGALRWHGVDEPVILGLLGGQLGGLGVSQVAQKASTASTQPAVVAQPAAPTMGG